MFPYKGKGYSGSLEIFFIFLDLCLDRGLSSKYGISASMVSNWKKSFVAGGLSKEVKQLKKELEEAKLVIEETYKELGKTKMENEFLKKKTNS
jgi:transposase-like protein